MNKCDLCHKIKSARHKSYEEIRTASTSDWLWASVVINFIVKLSLSKKLLTEVIYDLILIIVDWLTKKVRFLSYKEVSEETDIHISMKCNSALRTFKWDNLEQRQTLYVKILNSVDKTTEIITQAVNSLSFTDEWTNRVNESSGRAIFKRICRLLTNKLSITIVNSAVKL